MSRSFFNVRQCLFYIFLCVLICSGCGVGPDIAKLPQPRADLVAYQSASISEELNLKQDWWRHYQDPQLNRLIQEGLSKSPSIAEAVARVQKVQAQALVVGVSLKPSVTAMGSIGKYRQSYENAIPKAFVPKGFLDTGQALIDFNYELDFWHKNSHNVAAVLSELEASHLMRAQADIVLSASITSTYAYLVECYKEGDIVDEILSVREQTLTLLEQRHQHGLENTSTLEQARSSLAMARSDVWAMKEKIALTREGLAVLVGMTPDRSLCIVRPRISRIVPMDRPNVIPADLIGRRPDVIAAQRTLEAAARRIHVAQAGFYPNINLTGSLGYQFLGTGLGALLSRDAFTASLGPAIHLPLFDRASIEGQYQEARSDYNIALARYEAAILQALQEVASALSSKKALDALILNITQALRASERDYSIVEKRYKSGLSTYLDVLRAQDRLITSRRAMIAIRAKLVKTDIALMKALGGGFKYHIQDKKKP